MRFMEDGKTTEHQLLPRTQNRRHLSKPNTFDLRDSNPTSTIPTSMVHKPSNPSFVQTNGQQDVQENGSSDAVVNLSLKSDNETSNVKTMMKGSGSFGVFPSNGRMNLEKKHYNGLIFSAHPVLMYSQGIHPTNGPQQQQQPTKPQNTEETTGRPTPHARPHNGRTKNDDFLSTISFTPTFVVGPSQKIAHQLPSIQTQQPRPQIPQPALSAIKPSPPTPASSSSPLENNNLLPAVKPTTTPRITIEDEETDVSDCETPDIKVSREEIRLTRRWERERCDIAWRWSWLQLQVHDLDYQTNKCEELYQKKRRNKQKVIPLFNQDEKQHSLRTSGMLRPKRNRKLVRKSPSNPNISSGSLSRAAESHPLFSLKQAKRTKHKIDESSLKSSKRGSNKIGKRKILTSSAPIIPNKKTPRKRARLASSQAASPHLVKKKKKYLRTSDFDIDNYVIPYGMAVAPAVPVEKELCEIKTPSWRLLSPESSLPCEDETASSEEDTSDETIAMRHFEHELFERRRYLEPLTMKKRRGGAPPRIPSRGGLSYDFPLEFLVSNPVKQELERKDMEGLTPEERERRKKEILREQFEKIKLTYRNQYAREGGLDAKEGDAGASAGTGGTGGGEGGDGSVLLWRGGLERDFDPKRYIWDIIVPPPRAEPLVGEQRNVIVIRKTAKPFTDRSANDESEDDEWEAEFSRAIFEEEEQTVLDGGEENDTWEWEAGLAADDEPWVGDDAYLETEPSSKQKKGKKKKKKRKKKRKRKESAKGETRGRPRKRSTPKHVSELHSDSPMPALIGGEDQDLVASVKMETVVEEEKQIKHKLVDDEETEDEEITMTTMTSPPRREGGEPLPLITAVISSVGGQNGNG